MVKLLWLLLVCLVAAIPAAVVYFGILSAIKPLLDKMRATDHPDLIVKSHHI